ncbi:MAG: hypothetical protein IJK04_13835 [Kiritimatiellae bacterium]|nr:hypothetical protein [Kiritimatiellia bacterium]
MVVAASVAAEDVEAEKMMVKNTAATAEANLHAMRHAGPFAVFFMFLSTVFPLSFM